MAAEPTSRFAHLLQPIRDLSKVWNIEIAEELERYTEEVTQLLVTNPEDGVSQLNFAEAALLIQGSTAIYSRKVELLYQLVYQALDLMARKDTKKGRMVQSGLWAPIPESDELLTIDHLIKEGRNIVLDHSTPPQRQAEQRRVPLFLMPRDQADRRKTEFRISSCTVHPSGMYLLQASDAKLLGDPLGAQPAPYPLDAPLVPAPPAEVQDLDNRLQELLHGLAEPEAAVDPVGGYSPVVEDGAMMTPTKAASAALVETPGKMPLLLPGGAGAASVKSRILSAPDPWALLDEHESVGQDLRAEAGNSSKKVNAKKLLMGAEGLPNAVDFKGLSDAELWSGLDEAARVAPLLAAGNPVELLFLAVARQIKTGMKYESQRQGFSAVWLELEDLFHAASSKRRALRARLKKAGRLAERGVVTPHASEDEASEGEGGQDMMATPLRSSSMALTPFEEPSLTAEALVREEQRAEVCRLESMIEDAQVKYEATIREHLQAMQRGAEGDERTGFPQLYANVKRWQDQLAPVLREFEARPEFNINEYSQKFLTKMTNVQTGVDGDRAIQFARLVYGQPRWEVCRRFLTCLILTNQGNTDIVYDAEEERLNGFSIKLLNAERKMISLECEEEADAMAQLQPKSGPKKAIAPPGTQIEVVQGPAQRKRLKSGES